MPQYAIKNPYNRCNVSVLLFEIGSFVNIHLTNFANSAIEK